MTPQDIECDHLIIGSGIAGLLLGLKLADLGKVTVLAKGGVTDNNSWYAQGGIASVFDDLDHFDGHIADTLRVGGGLCHEDVVRNICESGPDQIRKLIELGVAFTEETHGSGVYHLSQEGGHSHRRVLHADDVTGKEVMRALIEASRHHPNVSILENQMAIDLITSDRFQPQFRENRVVGAYVFNRQKSEIYQVRSRLTYLCTGGSGRAYKYTSNPENATGDGLAMAWRAGCRMANLEFMQFHPTCLYHEKVKNYLISEAVRGEGAVLRRINGEDFMVRYHKDGSLAPRDVVSRAIDQELKSSGEPYVVLDVGPIGRAKFQRLFPNINQTCEQLGISPFEDMIPVVPAAHYNCGGIVVDKNGSTGVAGLYALGENACTGFHGANRLASNSLLEAIVMSDWVSRHVRANADSFEPMSYEIPDWNSGCAMPPDEFDLLNEMWDEIRRIMWNCVGIVRTDRRLKKAKQQVQMIQQDLNEYYWGYQVSDRLLEVRNLALVAELTIRCALRRKESRGAHFNLDYPKPGVSQPAIDTIIR